MIGDEYASESPLIDVEEGPSMEEGKRHELPPRVWGVNRCAEQGQTERTAWARLHEGASTLGMRGTVTGF